MISRATLTRVSNWVDYNSIAHKYDFITCRCIRLAGSHVTGIVFPLKALIIQYHIIIVHYMQVPIVQSYTKWYTCRIEDFTSRFRVEIG